MFPSITMNVSADVSVNYVSADVSVNYNEILRLRYCPFLSSGH